jgi:iron(III) transport system permease protein
LSLPALDDTAGAAPVDVRLPGAAATRAPAWLWITTAVVLIPISIPLVFLGGRVLDAGSAAWDVVTAGRTVELLARSLAFTASVTASASAIGVAAAWLTVRVDLPGRKLWTALIALPLVIPSYVIALTFISFAGPRGLFADFTGLGLPSISGFPGAWSALTISTYPYVFLVTRAALRRIDPVLEEAAHGLGASSWRTFRTIVLPQLRPSIVAGGLLAALYTLSDFGAVSLMRFDVFTRVIYAQYQGRIDRTPAAVLSMVLIAVALLVLWLEQRSRGRAAYFPTRAHGRTRTVGLRRRSTVAALSYLGTLVLFGLVLPLGTLAAWLIRGVARGDTIDMRWGAVTGSLTGSVTAALIAMVASVPIVVLTVRHRSRLTAWLERVVYLIFSLPHITVALAVVFFGASYLGPLYQSFAILVIVYAVLFLAQATGVGAAALLQVNPSLEEASRGLGKTRFETLRRITLPLISRGLLTGGALVFLTTMKELPATLLLRPTGFDTLAVRIWSTANDLFYARAAAPALLLVAVSAVPTYLILTRMREAA